MLLMAAGMSCSQGHSQANKQLETITQWAAETQNSEPVQQLKSAAKIIYYSTYSDSSEYHNIAKLTYYNPLKNENITMKYYNDNLVALEIKKNEGTVDIRASMNEIMYLIHIESKAGTRVSIHSSDKDQQKLEVNTTVKLSDSEINTICTQAQQKLNYYLSLLKTDITNIQNHFDEQEKQRRLHLANATELLK